MAQNFATRQPLYGRNQKGGAFVFTDESQTTGSVFFADSTNANATDAAGYGFNPDAPFKTIKFALTQCTAAKADRVYGCPGHTETISAAGGWTAVANVSVIGIDGNGGRPVISFSTSNNASIAVSAAGFQMRNLTIDCTGVAALNNPVNITAADCELRNIRFIVASATNQAVCAVQTNAAANGLVIDGCKFLGTANAGTTAAVIIVGGDRHQITNNWFLGAYSSGVGAIQNVTTACTNTVVESNTIQNFTAACTKAMVFAAASTGSIANNYMQILSGTAPITGAAMSWVSGNYYANAVATAGTLI